MTFMTADGRRDYLRDIAELKNQRTKKKSIYNGVCRINCNDGYVDVRHTRTYPIPKLYYNGMYVSCSVRQLLCKLNNDNVNVYDWHIS